MPTIQTGVVLGLSATDPSLDLEIHRATSSGGAGDTVVGQVAGTTTAFFDPLPIDGTTYYYAAKQVGENATASGLSPYVAAAAREVQPGEAPPQVQDGNKRVYSGLDPGGNVQSGILPQAGVVEGSSTFKLYRHREDISVLGPDTDGDVAVTFGQTYQDIPMVVCRGGQYVTFSNTLGTAVKQKLRLQVLNPTASGFTSRAQIISSGATTPQTDDFASGNSITVAAGTAALSLNPGGANDNTYTVHYFVTVTVDANASNFCSAILTVAIDTDDGLGGGFQERATFTYIASPSAGPPPYSAATSSWAHEQQPVVVSGLLVANGAQIRLRAKSFSVTNGGTGSFTIRGGDAGGSNPETYNGTTYNTASDTTESAIPSTGDAVLWEAQEVT